MAKANAKTKVLKELENTPIVHVACQRANISRNTFYRWKDEDDTFRKKATEAMRLGTDLVNDAAESNVLNGIKEGSIGYTKYWLSHKHDEYKKPFRYREAGISWIETERIKEYYEVRRKLSQLGSGRPKEEIEEAKRKSRKMLDMWAKSAREREKKLRAECAKCKDKKKKK
jgi:hypothetical protein